MHLSKRAAAMERPGDEAGAACVERVVGGTDKVPNYCQDLQRLSQYLRTETHIPGQATASISTFPVENEEQLPAAQRSESTTSILIRL